MFSFPFQRRTGMWYKREEQSLLNSLWYCMSGVQLMVSGDDIQLI